MGQGLFIEFRKMAQYIRYSLCECGCDFKPLEPKSKLCVLVCAYNFSTVRSRAGEALLQGNEVESDRAGHLTSSSGICVQPHTHTHRGCDAPHAENICNQTSLLKRLRHVSYQCHMCLAVRSFYCSGLFLSQVL